jgi:short-subunit dehydrogenase
MESNVSKNGSASVALVTGASSGLGRIMAETLAQNGYRVFGTSRRPEAIPAPSTITMITMDVDNDASVENGVNDVIEQAGRLDLVVCNAGFGVFGAIEDTPTADMTAQFQTNVFGVHRVCRATLPYLRQRKISRLIVVGSIAGLVGLPYQGMYSASKFALEGYCEVLRLELRGSPVRVALIQPGDFATGFTASRLLAGEANVSRWHRDSLARTMAVVKDDEENGGDFSLLSEAIIRLAADPNPALRNIVAMSEQEELALAKASYPHDEWEAMIAGHFGLDAEITLDAALV